MLCPAAVSAAAAAVWLLAVLGPGLSLPDEDNSDPGFSLCSHCFYRQMPPRGASAGPPLSLQCHTLPGGQAFATLSKSTCDTAVYSAFHLSHGWTERGEEAEEEEEEKKKKKRQERSEERGREHTGREREEVSDVVCREFSRLNTGSSSSAVC